MLLEIPIFMSKKRVRLAINAFKANTSAKTACDQYNLEKAKINEEKTEGIKIIQLISVLDVTG